MTIQERLRDTLTKSGLPAKEIKVFGSQILITCWSRDAANQWAALVVRFATLRGIVESRDYAKHNTNTMLRPSTVKVWRVAAHI